MNGPRSPHPLAAVAALLLAALASACRSLERLGHISPMGESDATATDRVNLWPLYYKEGTARAVLWPLFDDDEQGFALRPLITNQAEEWELLPPIAWWDNQTGDWIVVPFFHLGGASGLFPIIGLGSLNYVGPLWWNAEGGGLFPIAHVGAGLNFVGPAWWQREAGATTGWGLFPLLTFTEGFNQVGIVAWSNDVESGARMVLAAPFYFAWTDETGQSMWLTPLGGRSVSADGDYGFVNVLGPLYHRDFTPSETTTHVLWPLFSRTRGDVVTSWTAWPLAGHNDVVDSAAWRTWALAGLVEANGHADLDGLRVWPLFSVQGADSLPADFLHDAGLYGFERLDQDAYDLHIGTPLLFDLSVRADRREWSVLLGALDYAATDERTDFDLLWYLYRHHRQGTATRRDFFPFASFDTDTDTSDFAFLWRLLHIERNGDDYSGHILFVPFD